MECAHLPGGRESVPTTNTDPEGSTGAQFGRPRRKDGLSSRCADDYGQSNGHSDAGGDLL